MGVPSASRCVVCKRGALKLVHRTVRSQDDPSRCLCESDLERVHAAPRPKAMCMQSLHSWYLGYSRGASITCNGQCRSKTTTRLLDDGVRKQDFDISGARCLLMAIVSAVMVLFVM
jgi:hypothetical protein